MAQNKVTLNNVGVTFANFEGAIKQFNEKGKRVFSIVLEHETALAMEADGYNISWPKEKEGVVPDEDYRKPTLQVTVSNDRDNIPQSVRVFIVDKGIETRLENENIGMIDRLDISHADIQFNPYNWEYNGKTGVKPYLTTLKIYLFDAAIGQSTY